MSKKHNGGGGLDASEVQTPSRLTVHHLSIEVFAVTHGLEI